MSRTALLILALSSMAAAASLTPYGNTRFHYRVHVPVDLTPLPPPDNGDGQAWQSADGVVRVAAWGSYALGVLDIPTVNSYALRREQWEKKAGNRITYRKILTGAFLLSGYLKDGRIFYQKTLVRNGTETSVRIEYPVNRRAIWDKRVADIAGTLKWSSR